MTRKIEPCHCDEQTGCKSLRNCRVRRRLKRNRKSRELAMQRYLTKLLEEQEARQ